MTSTFSRTFRRVVVASGLALLPVYSAGAQLTATSAPASGSTTVTFNSLPDGTVLTNQIPGFTVSGYACASSYYNGFFGGDAIQVTNAQVGNCSGAGFSGTAGPLTFTFASPINTFGFNGIANSGSSLYFTTTGGSVSFTGGNFSGPFMGVSDPNGFSSITVNASPSPGFVFDNLSYGVTATPEPSSIALLGTGLVGLVPMIRRRRQR